VIGDKHGHVAALGERECSIQRKHQKVIEETPSPAVDERLRRKLVKAAADAAEHIKYDSLGTFEFLLDEKENFYFMEANTRVQVEHPITEMVYSIDLVQEQIRIAAGEKLSVSDDMKMRGHSLECRINAEDPVTYSPSPGTIDFLVFPGGNGIRVDSAAYQGWRIPPDYDSLVAKIAVQAASRPLAIKKMQAALEMTTVVGIKTNLPLHLQILADSDFLKGQYDTQFMERFQLKMNGRVK